MDPLPHTYTAIATSHPSGLVPVSTTTAPALITAAPMEFGGPGNQWSPEGLLCAAVADCFVLTFRSIARAAKLDWLNLKCRVEGRLDRTDSGLRFTHFTTYADITVPAGSDIEHVERLLERTERECLVANSLNGGRSLEMHVNETARVAIEASAF